MDATEEPSRLLCFVLWLWYCMSMTTHADPVLAVRNVSKLFGAKPAVENIDLTVNRSEIFGFLGPNGAGKSTTIKLILDILRPTSGTIELFGIDNRRTVETHSRIGYLSGDMVLDEDLTGRQYLAFVAHAYGGVTDDRIKTLASSLQADLAVRIGTYSRGNKQKIGLIAAMMHQPELLILDEPSSGFDPLMQEVFIHLIEDYRKAGGTVFISSHTLGEVQRLCDRVGFIRAGRLVGVTDIDDLDASASKQVRVTAPVAQLSKLKSSLHTIKGLKLQDDLPSRCTLSYSGDIQLLLKFLTAFSIEDLTIQEPELDEIFMSYYSEGGIAS
jgi:ABC-2 type transport system ATP-binding protein